MSLALIQESAKEVRRLAIAGGSLARGDFRLKKLAAPLEQAGAKVPVFAQVAKAINEVVDGDEARSSERLLALGTLLNAILYTQGQTSCDGAFAELESSTPDCVTTRTPARVIKPLIQALTTSGGGRFETVKAAFEQGLFSDLRLVGPSIQALDDNYPDLADLVAEKILPSHGPGIAPGLKAGIDLKGKRADARRLEVLCKVAPREALPLCKAALEDGSADVKVAAIAYLGGHEEYLPLVQEQAQSRNKQVRVAALEALARHNRPEITKLFGDLIIGKALDVLSGPFRILKNAALLGSLLNEGRRVFDLMLQGDSEQIPRFCEILDCLASRHEPEVEKFLLACFDQSDRIAKLKAPNNSHVGGADVVVRLAERLFLCGSQSAFDSILTRRDSLPSAAFDTVLNTAFKAWPPGNVFDEFSPLLASAKGAQKSRFNALYRRILAAGHFRSGQRTGSDTDMGMDTAELDPRWLDAAIAADHDALVCLFARPGHSGALEYLLKIARGEKGTASGGVVNALVRCNYPEVTSVFLDLVSRKTKSSGYVDYELQLILGAAPALPVTDLPKLEAFASTLPDKFTDRFLDAISPLRTASSNS